MVLRLRSILDIGEVSCVFLPLLSSAFNLLTRSMTCVLLQLKGAMTLVAQVLGGDLVLFFVVKALRRDLRYWMPVYGVGAGVSTFLICLITKVVGDWTAVVQTRSSVDVGGVYFTFGLLITAIVGIIAAAGYKKVEGEEGTLTKETVIKAMATCCVGMTISFVALLCSMNKTYVHTFLSTETGNKSV